MYIYGDANNNNNNNNNNYNNKIPDVSFFCLPSITINEFFCASTSILID